MSWNPLDKPPRVNHDFSEDSEEDWDSEDSEVLLEDVDATDNEWDEWLEDDQGERTPLVILKHHLPSISTCSAMPSGERLQVSRPSPQASTSSDWSPPGPVEVKAGWQSPSEDDDEDYQLSRRGSAPVSPGSRSRSPHAARHLSPRQTGTAAAPLPTGAVNVFDEAGEATAHHSRGVDAATRSVIASVPSTSTFQAQSPEVMSGSGPSCRSMRGGVRGACGGVPRARQARSERRAVDRRAQRWQVGDPLVEVYKHDADVDPRVLRVVAEDERICQEKMRENASRRSAAREARREIIERENESENLEGSDGVSGAVEGGQTRESFQWLPCSEAFHGELEVLRVERTGSVNAHDSPYSAFRSLWPDELVEHIVSETNLFAAQLGGRYPQFAQAWYDTNADEILCLFAFWMMLGIIQMPSIEECFSTDTITRTDAFRKLFTEGRYKRLSRALHFVGTTDADAADDRMYRLRPIVSSLNSTFQSNYTLNKDICINESFPLLEGPMHSKQYIRNKPEKNGIKSFELCESSTGYLWACRYYTNLPSLDNLPVDVNTSTGVVMELMTPLLNKGYTLYMDNWYNSPALARWLKQNGTDCVGTLRLNCKNVPRLFSRVPLSQGQFIARHSGDLFLLSWQDKKRITTLSTYHQNHTAQARVWSKVPCEPLPHKPQVVLDYNRCMESVVKDQVLEPYLERQREGSLVKLFKRLVTCSILNARTIYASSTGKPQHHLTFSKQLAFEIIANHLCDVPRPRAVISEPILNKHWPQRIPERLQCVVCYGLQQSGQTKVQCSACKVPLCIECFKTFHTHPDFTGQL